MITIFFAITTALSLTGVFYSVKRNLIYMEKLEQIDELVQNSLNVLQDSYNSIDRKSKLEVFFDDPVVRELVQDISNAKSAIEVISSHLDDVVDNDDDSVDD